MNNILKYAPCLERFSEELLETVCDQWDNGENYSVSEAKDVIEEEINNYVSELKSKIASAESMIADLRKLSKPKFLYKYA